MSLATLDLLLQPMDMIGSVTSHLEVFVLTCNSAATPYETVAGFYYKVLEFCDGEHVWPSAVTTINT